MQAQRLIVPFAAVLVGAAAVLGGTAGVASAADDNAGSPGTNGFSVGQQQGVCHVPDKGAPADVGVGCGPVSKF